MELDDDDADDDVISWRNPPGILCRPRFCVVLFMVRYVIPDRLVVVLLFSGVCRDLGVVPRCPLPQCRQACPAVQRKKTKPSCMSTLGTTASRHVITRAGLEGHDRRP